MPNITGTITTKRTDGKSIQIDGEWYGAFAPAMLTHVNVGDSVTFEYIEKPGTGAHAGRVFKNIKGAVKHNGGLASSIPMSSSTPSNTKPGEPPLHTQRCIIRQNALSAAVHLIGPIGMSTIDFSSVTDEVLKLAAIFEGYTSGDDDVAAVKEEMGVS